MAWKITFSRYALQLFLFSRVPWELAKIALLLTFAGYLAYNSRLLTVMNNGKIGTQSIWFGTIFGYDIHFFAALYGTW